MGVTATIVYAVLLDLTGGAAATTAMMQNILTAKALNDAVSTSS